VDISQGICGTNGGMFWRERYQWPMVIGGGSGGCEDVIYQSLVLLQKELSRKIPSQCFLIFFQNYAIFNVVLKINFLKI
jgi:hypothetical protein